jgi:hypothetical protein
MLDADDCTHRATPRNSGLTEKNSARPAAKTTALRVAPILRAI